MAAAAIGGALALGGSLLSSRNQRKATNKGLEAQRQATDTQLQLGREQLAFAKQQGRENIAFQKQQGAEANARLQPFVNFGRPFMGQAQDFINQPNVPLQQTQALLDPQAQYNYLQSNPMFNAAIETTNRAIGSQGAASGKFGGMVDALFKNYLATGNSFINNRFDQLGAADRMRGNQYNRLLTPIEMSQNAATGQASNIQNTANQVGATNQFTTGQVGMGNQNMQSIYGNLGDINSSAAIAQGNIKNQQLGGLLGAIGGGIGGYQTQAQREAAAAGGGWGGAMQGILSSFK